MRPNSRLDKTINGLNELVQRHNKQDKFKISKDYITIEANGSQFLGTIFYVSVILLLPAGLLVYHLLTDNTNTIIFWLFLFEVLFGYDLWKMTKGNTLLTIDFTTKQFRIENINGVFKTWFKTKSIAFDELTEVCLKEKSVVSKYSRTVWLQLTGTDKQKNSIVFTDMSNDYPESSIARKVKVLFDVIIWTQKQNIVHAV
ncbi:MAG: hypothetical protein L6Q77_07275 [Bacteroidetes bacterium]|nr:hypothetical protein [Bacteroidota bacterium]